MNDDLLQSSSRRAFLLRSEMSVPRVSISDDCFAQSGVYCESCRDICETGTLRFAPALGSVPRPILDANLCTQCSECAQVCPRDAIRVRPKDLNNG